MDASIEAATEFLKSLLNKTLRVTTTDTRLFVGEFKCTDAERNIILSCTYEYRLPSLPTITQPSPSDTIPTSTTTELENEAAAADDNSSSEKSNENSGTGGDKIVQDMTSRYLGLVVVPGEFITKIEVQEFASQVKASGGSRYANLVDDATASSDSSSSGLGDAVEEAV